MRVPSLRERQPDILELAAYFLERHRAARPLRLSAAAAQALLVEQWPGTVRELAAATAATVANATDQVLGTSAQRFPIDDPPPRSSSFSRDA